VTFVPEIALPNDNPVVSFRKGVDVMRNYIAATLLILSAVSVNAKVVPDIKVVTYPVSGSSLAELERAMNRDGPQGFWAYTEWFVNWSAQCDVTMTATIQMPRLANGAGLSQAEQREFARMLIALKSHEMQHAYIGVFAADEVERYHCRNTDQIFGYWNAQDVRLDDRTNHGVDEGATLYY